MKFSDFHVVNYWQYAACRSLSLFIPVSSTPPFSTFVSCCSYVLLSPHGLNTSYPMFIRQHLVFCKSVVAAEAWPFNQPKLRFPGS